MPSNEDLSPEREVAAAAESFSLGRVSELIDAAGAIVKNAEERKINPEEFRFLASLLKGAADLAYPRPQSR